MRHWIFWVFVFVMMAVHLCLWRLDKNRSEGECRAWAGHLRPGKPAPVSGFRCRFPARNPGVVEDGRLAFLPWAISREAGGLRTGARELFMSWVQTRLTRWPKVRGLSLAVWFGQTSELPAGFKQLYRESGLLHILALSGQHVASLCLVFNALLGFLARFAISHHTARTAYRIAGRSLPIAGALALWILNPANEPVARATAMLLAYSILSTIGLRVGALQIAASCSAILLLLSPERMASDSFLLSALATLYLCAWISNADPFAANWKQYLSLSLVMPILLLPACAFFFAKISPMAGVNGILVGWIWSLVWVPLGFLAPVLPSGLLDLSEWIWRGFCAAQDKVSFWMAWGYRSVLRPTWFEWLLAQSALTILVFGTRRKLTQWLKTHE